MADIELVIKIPQFIYEQILKRHVGKITIAHIFKNGTPLPRGHGDLKDIETFKLTYGHDGAYYRFKDIIDAPTIIEADKGDKE